MPTYTYECPECKLTYEVQQRITESPLESCNMCNQAKPTRIITTSAAPLLKGGGWAADNYSSKKPT
jgi:putative FmdB family regulatory protein